jgi:hypothetical protein
LANYSVKNSLPQSHFNVKSKSKQNAAPNFSAQRFCVGGSVPDGVCHCTLRCARNIACQTEQERNKAILELRQKADFRPKHIDFYVLDFTDLIC